jgi:hypothetical protein
MQRALTVVISLFFSTLVLSAAPITQHIHVGPIERSAAARCVADPDGPIDISLEAFAPQRRVGGFVEVIGRITARADVDALRLRFGSEGAATIFNRAPLFVGRLAAGGTAEFSLLARFSGEGEIHVWGESDNQPEDYRWSKRETLYGIVHRDRLYTGIGDAQRLKVAAIQEDVALGLITQQERENEIARLSLVPFVRHDRPLVQREFNAAEEMLNSIVGATPARRGRIGLESHHPPDMILVQGNVTWTDENGATHPVFGASVSIRDSDTLGDETITVVGTDVDGNYSAIVDNDDGIGAGDRDIYVVVRAENTLVDTQNGSGDTYTMQSPVHDETPDGATITENFTAANTGVGPAFSVFQAGTWIAVYARERNGGAIASVDIVWPNGDDGSFYDGDVQIEQPDRWDWDTIHHEYGHYVMDVLDIEDNPGGPHNITNCHAVVRGSKDEGLRLAWGEGWPTFFGTAGQQVYNMASLNVPRVGDAGYDDLEDGSVSYNLEAQSAGGQGEDNELAVQRLLWDLFDSANDGRDTVSRSDQSMWDAVNGADPETLSGGWGALRGGQSNSMNLLMGEIASDHAIGPRLIAPADGATVSPSNANFSWNADVGCDSSFDGNSFDLVFYDAASLAPILTVPALGTTSTSLSDAQIGTLTATTHQVLWAVEGRNTSSPATGPYLGESFALTVNRPPVADAGADQTVECTSAGTTAVALNGTASSDPDGDTITWSWSAPGITFNDSSSATPTGRFPIGTTVVTLTVSDGIQQDTDTVSITVQDTTPPVLVCPVNIIVECTGNLGVDASDPQLAPFFAGASATDTCDSTPTISNDAPAFFGLGSTIVTFTAVDDHGNSSTCQATVTVVDTSAPTITASVTPTVLHPPNHKMAIIETTVAVTDECDPNPTFVLTSIISNEPDNGLGDGDQPNDIQGADYGTADTAFLLRAERAGVLRDRVYTITYTGSDSSGNTSTVSVTVTVPHN